MLYILAIEAGEIDKRLWVVAAPAQDPLILLEIVILENISIVPLEEEHIPFIFFALLNLQAQQPRRDFSHTW